jgi:hypothetical protein
MVNTAESRQATDDEKELGEMAKEELQSLEE